MRGRKPTPTELHKLKGTFNVTKHARNRKGEPVAVVDLTVEPPDWMTDTQQASWRYAMEHAPKGLLKKIDAGTLAVWVIAEDEHRTASMMQAIIDSKSTMKLLTKDKSGLAVASPYLGLTHRAGLRMLKAASDLGFSPAARPRIGTGGNGGKTDDESPWGQFEVINGGRGPGKGA